MSVVGPQLYPDDYLLTNVWGNAQPKVAAGADISVTVPNGQIWRVASLRALLTASGNAANRNVGFIVKNQDGTSVYEYNLTAALTAGQSGVFTFSKDVASVPTAIATTNRLLMPMSSEPIPAGWSFGTSTLNIDASDQWSAIGLWVETLLPPRGE